MVPELEKEFREQMTIANSKRLLIFLAVISLGEVILVTLELSSILEYSFEMIMMQSIVLASCIVIFTIVYFLNKYNKLAALYVFITASELAIMAVAIMFNDYTFTLGSYGFSGFFLGAIIVSVVFTKEYYQTILVYISAYVILCSRLALAHDLEMILLIEIVNVTFLLVLLCLGAIIQYNNAKSLFKKDNKIKMANVELERRAITDVLTGLYNRRKVYDLFENLFEESQKSNAPLSVILIDIDHFKSINDEYGHNIGDEVLKEFALRIRLKLRTNDTVGRWGGEEFIIICKDADVDSAQFLATRLCKFMRKTPFSKCGTITFSAGVSQLQKGETPIQLVDRADEALYLAKNSGRNCVKVIS
jgi:diguanylate cyclase (GGDEF)-like protein